MSSSGSGERIGLPLTVNCTLPNGVIAVPAVLVTVAVIVTVAPGATGFADERSEVDVCAGWMSVCSEPLLWPKVESPP